MIEPRLQCLRGVEQMGEVAECCGQEAQKRQKSSAEGLLICRGRLGKAYVVVYRKMGYIDFPWKLQKIFLILAETHRIRNIQSVRGGGRSPCVDFGIGVGQAEFVRGGFHCRIV